MRIARPLTVLPLLWLFASPGFAVERVPAQERLVFPLAWEATSHARPFRPVSESALGRSIALPSNWQMQTDRRTGTAHFAYGSGIRLANRISTEAQAENLAISFALSQSEALGLRADNFETRAVVHARGKWVVHFQQRETGLPVWHASAFVALGDDGFVIATGSSFFPAQESGIARASISGEDALANSASDLGTAIRTDRPTETALWLVPVPGDSEWMLAPAWRTQFEAEEPFGVWESLVHANTGEILARENLICPIEVVGNVDGMTQDFSYCDGTSDRPMRNVRVNVSGGSNDLTDENGDFVIANAGSTPVTVTAALNGQNFNVNRFSGLGADASFSGSATPGTPLQITWTTANARQDEIDTYFHAERAHQFMIDIDTAFDTVNLPHPMIATVGRTDNICPGNAWYSIAGRNINFCAASGSWANTGELGNVIYHEYGHGVSAEVYAIHGANLPTGDMHEGNSDVIANFIDRTSVVGIGFTNCSAGIRNADNDLQWPSDNDGGHYGGQIIAGFYWDSWQAMLAALPQSEADQAAWDGWHFARWLGQPLNQQDQVTWTFLADDDDSNLDNGTPHHEFFRLGADNHNFSWPAITVGVFINHQKLGHTTNGSLGFDVVADIQGVGVTLDPTSPTVFYRVNDGSWQSLAMAATGTPNEFSAHIPAQSNFAELDYYVYAADTNANATTNPDNAPSVFHSFDVVFDYDGGESGPGLWTAGVAGDTATKGQWELADPVATLAQPGDQTTPGGTMAWITGQCGPPNCTGSCVMPQENGCNDVDNGVTSLLSPVYDVSGSTAAKVKFDYWLSNDTGLSPGHDPIKVDVSNDGGSTWTSVLNTTVSTNAWVPYEFDLLAYFATPNLVRLRFQASDSGIDSVVEAAIDEFRILANLGGPTDTPELPTALPRALSLSQNRPNPFDASTSVEFALPKPGHVSLTVHDVAGRTVAVLQDGVQDAGVHRAQWDGRDTTGRQVAAGIYFTRLTVNGETRTKKMTLLP